MPEPNSINGNGGDGNKETDPPKAKPEPHHTIQGTVFWITMNIVTVVAIVIINKRIYTTHKFVFGNTLCMLHLATTGAMIWLFELFGMFKRKAMPLKAIFILSFSNLLSIMFVNLSLLYNSVGMYQVLKLANIPVLCVIEYFWQGKTYSSKIKGSLAILLVGIAICTVTELHFSQLGFCFGAVATLGTGWYQILVGTEQKKYEANGLQVLMWQAPLMALMFFALIPVTDDIVALRNYVWTASAAVEIALSCLIALLINVSVFFIIGRASPLTYQVVGHLKTSLVFVFGWTIIKEPIIPKNVMGIALAFVGMMWYTHLKSSPGTGPTQPKVLVEPTTVKSTTVSAQGERDQ